MTKRFGLVLDDDLYDEFRRCFIDHGQKTALLRRCVQKLVKKAREAGEVRYRDIGEITDAVFEKSRKENLK